MDVNPMESPLEGASNFRDFGGYTAAGGQRVKRGHLFRSNKLSRLTDADRARLDAWGICAIFDLRLEDERLRDPTAWTAPGLVVDSWPPRKKKRLVDMAAEYPPTEEGVFQLMHEFYAKMPHSMTHMFSGILSRLAEGATPCIIHCSAGKDRTGVAVAMVLAALGVPRETIVADYALTQKLLRREELLAPPVNAATGDVTSLRDRYPPEVAAMIWASAPTYIEAALDSAEARYGSLEAYLETALGVSPDLLEALRARLLEPA